jgi:hypothetical protein
LAARFHESQCQRDAGSVVAWPVVVLREAAVHVRRLGPDDHEVVGDERAKPERLPMTAAVVAGDRPGVAGDEQRVVPRQQRTHVGEEIRPLRQVRSPSA